MNILACDSMGVRSLSVEAGGLLIDPGAALGPARYGLAPHRLELEALQKATGRIKGALAEAKRVSISHYHYDHYMPGADYGGKTLFLKDWEANINRSQSQRAGAFLERLEGQDAELVKADGQDFGRVEFSPAVPHGPEGGRLGYVVMAFLPKEKLVHASDVQGPQSGKTADWIMERNPETLVLSGFPTLFLGWRVPYKSLEKSNALLCGIISGTDIKTIVLDHHPVRDLHYKKRVAPVFEEAEKKGVQVLTGAEYMGREPEMLEARRKELWKASGPKTPNS